MNDETLKREIHALFGEAQADDDGGYHSLYDGKWLDVTDEVQAVAAWHQRKLDEARDAAYKKGFVDCGLDANAKREEAV